MTKKCHSPEIIAYITETTDTIARAQMENHPSFFITVLEGIVLFAWTDCSAFSFLFLFFFFKNETVSAGNGICSPAKRQRAEMDSHEAAELGYVFPVHAHENKEDDNEGP